LTGKISDFSTQDRTDLDTSKQLEVEDVDDENKKPQEEEDFWEWQAKQLAYLKLPVFSTPRQQLRSFSTDRKKLMVKLGRRKKENECDNTIMNSRLNRSVYSYPPSAEINEEEEIDPLMQHRFKQLDEKYGRKNRWIIKVEKEEDRTREFASVTSNKASSCYDAINTTINKRDAVSEYKGLLAKMNDTCRTKLKKIDQEEQKKRQLEERRKVMLPGTSRRRMTSAEYREWREAYNKKRLNYTTTTWRTDTKPTPKIMDKAKSNVSMPVIKKSEIIRPVERANTETRWNFANKNVRALI